MDDILFLSCKNLRKRLMETNFTLKDVERIRKIRRRERSKALDKREEEGLLSQISHLQDIKNTLMAEKMALNSECEFYRFRMA